jgi:ABC-type multidrug transport system permease subunit
MRWLLLKDLRILRRSPLLVGMLIVYPIVIAALVGFALTSGPSKPRVAFVNEIPPGSGKVSLGGEDVDIAKEAAPLFNSIDAVRVKDRQEAIKKVRDGDVLAALVIPGDVTAKLQAAAAGSFEPAHIQVYSNAGDPAKQTFVDNTIKARLQDANAALGKKLTAVAIDYLGLITRGGTISLLGQSFDVLGLQKAGAILKQLQAKVPPDSQLGKQLKSVIDFARLAQDNLSLSTQALDVVGAPIRVDKTVVKGSKTPLGAFAVAIAVTVTLMFITLLLAAGALALEREENAFRRLVRGLVSRTGLLVEKVGLAAVCSTVVALIMLAGLSLFVNIEWGRFPLWFVALAAGAVGFAALGVAMGALAREVRAASLLAFMASLPIAVLALVPAEAVSSGLYDVIRIVSAAFPFKPTLDALNAALNRSGGLGLPLLHLAILTVAFTAAARLAIRRFA